MIQIMRGIAYLPHTQSDDAPAGSPGAALRRGTRGPSAAHRLVSAMLNEPGHPHA